MDKKPEYMDFVGFTYNGVHSSTFNIIRTSDGDRYQEPLMPDLDSESVDIPGGDGAYYEGSNFKMKQIEIPIAFDNVTEMDKQRLRHWLYPDHNLHELIFDEHPYKKYYVKLSSAAELEDICFYERYERVNGKRINGERVYKGEGTLQFDAYMPFSVEVDKRLEYYENFEEDERYENLDEWVEASGIKAQEETGVEDDGTLVGAPFTLYNPSNIESDYELVFAKSALCWDYKAATTSGEQTFYKMIAEGTPVSALTDETSIYKGKTLYTYKDGNVYEIRISDDKETAQIGYANDTEFVVADTAYFDDNVTPAISNNIGVIYDIYTQETQPADTHFCTYTLQGGISNAIDAVVGQLIYVYFKDRYIQCQITARSFDEKYITLYNAEVNLQDDTYSTARIYTTGSQNLTVHIGDKYTYIIKFPSVSTTNPRLYTPAQKAAMKTTVIKINTNKQTIEYLDEPFTVAPTPHDYIFNNDGNWVGVSGVLTGELGKIPISGLDPDMLNLPQMTIECIESEFPITGTPPALYYHYMYM